MIVGFVHTVKEAARGVALASFDGPLAPMVFTACTWKKTSVPLSKPVTVLATALSPVGALSGISRQSPYATPSARWRYSWRTTGLPPSWADGVHDSRASPSPGEAARPVGGAGTRSSGVNSTISRYVPVCSSSEARTSTKSGLSSASNRILKLLPDPESSSSARTVPSASVSAPSVSTSPVVSTTSVPGDAMSTWNTSRSPSNSSIASPDHGKDASTVANSAALPWSSSVTTGPRSKTRMPCSGVPT